MAKYCTKCGRKLEDGEVCNCTSQNTGATPNTAGNQQAAQGAQQTYQNAQQSYQQNQQTYQNAQQSYQQSQQTYQQNQQAFQNGQQTYQQNQQAFQSGQQAYQQNQQAFQNGQQAYQQNQQTYQNGQQFYQQNQQGGPTKEAEWINRQKNAFVSGTKNMFSEILPILKSPVGRIRQISASANGKVGIQLIVSKAVIFLLVVIIALLMIANKINEASYGFVEADIPYFSFIFVTLILTAGIDFLEAVILKALSGAFGGITNVNTMFNVIGARCIFDVFILVITVILGLMAWEIAFVAFSLLSPISLYIQFSAYQGCVNMKEDKKPYAYFIAKVCMSIISALVVYLIIRTSLNAAMDSILGGMF